jgi:hypothetical protein
MKNVWIYKNKKKKVKIDIFVLNNDDNYLEKTTKGKRQKTACGCAFLQQDRVECLANDILVPFPIDIKTSIEIFALE